MIIGSGPGGGTGGIPSGTPGVQWAWQQLQWDLRFTWPARQQNQQYLARIFSQIPAKGG